MKIDRFYLRRIALTGLLPVLLFAGCVPCPSVAPAYLEGTFYRMTGTNTFDYVQFTSNGFLGYVTITPEIAGMDAVQVYEEIAVAWLEPFNVPGHTGNYVLLGDDLYLNYEPHESVPALNLTGTYASGQVTIYGPGGEMWEYGPLSAP